MTKVRSIDIQSFGSFKKYDWSTNVSRKGSTREFKRLNILYGRNYSGKTTLSRIFRSYEVHSFPENYQYPSFSLTTDSGEVLNATKITSDNLDIRVYNKDFIKGNLSFLEDHGEGDIKTFAVMGSDNQQLEEKIKDEERKIGSEESESGLAYRKSLKYKAMNSAKSDENEHNSSLEKKLKDHANNVIKKNRTYGNATYNITKIKSDIANIKLCSTALLSDDDVSKLISEVKEDTLDEITVKPGYSPKSEYLYEKAKELVGRVIEPTSPIEYLLNEPSLQAWVKDGIAHHRDKRESCGFCNQALPVDLWEKLDNHFNKDSEGLDAEIGKLIGSIKDEMSVLTNILGITKDSFYSSEKTLFESCKQDFDQALIDYKKQLSEIMGELTRRKNDIFSEFEIAPLVNDGSVLVDSINKISKLIELNNKKTKTLESDRVKAIDKLRIDDVARFIRDIGLDGEDQKSKELALASSKAEEEYKHVEEQIDEINRSIEQLKIQQNDEKKGADQVNNYLNHFFGHNGLRLQADEVSGGSTFKFQIMRGDERAYNLSEGECSLISFCYFMAKLEDTKSKGKDLIVYIDDPISSLDSNHIFFVFSLIESVLAKPLKNEDGSNRYRYEQLFISTHNLDFFKYLKRLSHPNKREVVNGKSVKIPDSEYFLIEGCEDGSRIRLMPDYLKNYTTEFNYLFHQIYLCKDAENAEGNYEKFYSFGNNLRKFLEAFLFYRYPYHYDKNNSLERLSRFFGDDSAATALTNRVSNELSHLEEIFDRSMRPVDIPEIPRLANFVLDKIFEKDPDQYNALLKSIGEPERER